MTAQDHTFNSTDDAITLFGAFAVRMDGRTLPTKPPKKTRLLLVALLLRAAQKVEQKNLRDWQRPELVRLIWPDSASEHGGTESLDAALAELRRWFGEAKFPRRSPTLLVVDPDAVDLAAFARCIADADTASLARAVELQARGPLLPGYEEPWIAVERARREAQCLRALETLAERALGERDYRAAAEHLCRASGLDPEGEAALRRLMSECLLAEGPDAALLLCEAVEDALRALSVPRALSPETAALRERLKAARRHSEAPSAPVCSLPNYPAPLGRGPLVAAIKERLRGEARLMTLTGSGGVGKTRVAVQVARDLQEQRGGTAVFVDLGPLAENDSVAGARSGDASVAARFVAQKMGLSVGGDQSPTDVLVGCLRGRAVSLLVLDTCERVYEACAEMTEVLLLNCPSLRILATSQRGLGVMDWEHLLPIPPLPSPPKPEEATPPDPDALRAFSSVQLFVQRARQVRPDFALTEATAHAVAQVCHYLDGVPLFLELAASLKVEETAQRLHRLERLPGARTGGARRHRTLGQMLEWSYQPLPEPEKALLRRLSLFVGGWTLPAAEVVCVGGVVQAEEVFGLLTRLVSKSLAHEDREGPETGRYHLLEAVRQYGRDRLGEGEKQAGRRRHFQWCLAFARQNDGESPGPDQSAHMDRLESEHDNLRAALAWAVTEGHDGEGGLLLAGHLWKLWEQRGYLGEGYRWFSAAWARARPGAGDDTTERAQALNGGAVLSIGWRDARSYPLAEAMLAEALRICEKNGDAFTAACVRNTQTYLAQQQNRPADAARIFAETADVFRGCGDRYRLSLALRGQADAVKHQGDLAHARALLEQSVALVAEPGHRDDSLAWVLHHLGAIALAQNDLEEANRCYKEARGIFEALHTLGGVCIMEYELASVARRRGDLAEVERCLRRSITAGKANNDKRRYAWPIFDLVRLLIDKPDREAARALLEEALVTFADSRGEPDIDRALADLTQRVVSTAANP